MEISELVSFITGMEVKQVISLIVIMWFFTKPIRRDIDNLRKDMENMEIRINRIIEKIETKQNHTEEKINDIMMRLARIEGMLSAKECCLLGSDDKIKKAE